MLWWSWRCIAVLNITRRSLKTTRKKNLYVAECTFRNEGIYDLVWDKNPFVVGKKFGEWNAGDLPSIPYREDGFLEENGTGDMIPNWEKFNGLKPTNKYPKVYYEPEKDKGIKDYLCRFYIYYCE